MFREVAWLHRQHQGAGQRHRTQHTRADGGEEIRITGKVLRNIDHPWRNFRTLAARGGLRRGQPAGAGHPRRRFSAFAPTQHLVLAVGGLVEGCVPQISSASGGRGLGSGGDKVCASASVGGEAGEGGRHGAVGSQGEEEVVAAAGEGAVHAGAVRRQGRGRVLAPAAGRL